MPNFAFFSLKCLHGAHTHVHTCANTHTQLYKLQTSQNLGLPHSVSLQGRGLE